MTTFPNSPQLLKGGLVLLDPERGNQRGRESYLDRECPYHLPCG